MGIWGLEEWNMWFLEITCILIHSPVLPKVGGFAIECICNLHKCFHPLVIHVLPDFGSYYVCIFVWRSIFRAGIALFIHCVTELKQCSYHGIQEQGLVLKPGNKIQEGWLNSCPVLPWQLDSTLCEPPSSQEPQQQLWRCKGSYRKERIEQAGHASAQCRGENKQEGHLTWFTLLTRWPRDTISTRLSLFPWRTRRARTTNIT